MAVNKGVKRARAKAPAPSLPVPQSAAEADDAIRRIGTLQGLIDLHQAAHTEHAAALVAAVHAQIQPLRDEMTGLTEGLRTWAEANRAALQMGAGGAKTIQFSAGCLRWRVRPPRVTIKGAVETVIARIKALDLAGHFLRTAEAIDREAMLRQPELAGSIEGVTIGSAGEDFEVIPATAEIAALPQVPAGATAAGVA
jgi:phage host-nuclease inhibitor protein Gam